MNQTTEAMHPPEGDLFRCTCPCLSCIEGNHCGMEYLDEDGNLIGVCYHPCPDDDGAFDECDVYEDDAVYWDDEDDPELWYCEL